jgi:hypothetical protein
MTTKLYIAVLDEFPDYMVPTLVAHSMLGAHLYFTGENSKLDRKEFIRYVIWLEDNFKKCLVRVNQREFDKIAALSGVYLGHESTTLEGRKSCAVVCPIPDAELPNVLKFAKLWSPKIASIDPA